MVSALLLIKRSGFEPWLATLLCVVFLGKTIYSHSATLHPGVQMGTGELNSGGNPAMDWHRLTRLKENNIVLYYIDTDVLLKNIQLVKFIKNTSGT